jgi:hypothetical protein
MAATSCGCGISLQSRTAIGSQQKASVNPHTSTHFYYNRFYLVYQYFQRVLRERIMD